MKTKGSGSVPRYQQIALAIASRIANGEYSVGERISGRSSIAGQYNVSPETARRAFCILADWEIVFPEKGSGMLIRSKENAVSFIRRFSEQKNIGTIKESIYQSIERQKSEMLELNDLLSELITATEQYHTMNPLVPWSVQVTSACRFLNKSVREIELWQHTGATLIAIKRDGMFFLSPGPNAVLMEEDVLYFITQEMSDQRVRAYLYPEEAE